MFELIYPATSLLTTGLLSWSTFRAWRAKNPLLKWGGAGLAALLSTLTALVSVVLIIGLLKLHARSAPTLVMKVEGTPEQVRRGQAIADSFCGACHSKTGPLTGGADIRSVVAYLRSLPASGDATPHPSDRISALGLMMLGAGLLPTGKPVSN